MIYLILLLAFVVRLINLNQSLWLDEAITAQVVIKYPFWEIITKFALGDVHPPLYYLLVKFWSQIFGHSEISLRFPSVIFGTLTVFFVFLIANKLLNQKTAALAAFFLALNPLAVYYSQEARSHVVAMFFVTAAMYFFIAKKRFLFAFFWLAAMYTDYLPWLLWPLFLRYWPVGLLAAPVLPILWHQVNLGVLVADNHPLWGKVVGGLEPKSVPLTLVKFIFGRITIDNKISYALTFGPVSALYLWILSNAKTKILWLWLGLPIALGFLVSFFVPVYSYFRFLFVLPAFVILLAEGAKNNIKFITFIIIINIISLAIFNLNPKFFREDWRGAVAYMEKGSGRAFIPSLAQAPAVYYYRKTLPINDRDSINLAGEKNIYLIRYVQEIFDQRDFLKNIVEAAGYKKIEEKFFNGVLIWKYQI